MTPEQFKAWRKAMDYTQAQAADALGISKESVANYDAGARREGRPVTIPKPVALACMALRMGVTEYAEP